MSDLTVNAISSNNFGHHGIRMPHSASIEMDLPLPSREADIIRDTEPPIAETKRLDLDQKFNFDRYIGD